MADVIPTLQCVIDRRNAASLRCATRLIGTRMAQLTVPMRIARVSYLFPRAYEDDLKNAERAGFEPAVRFDPDTSLAMMRIRPLCHLSGSYDQAADYSFTTAERKSCQWLFRRAKSGRLSLGNSQSARFLHCRFYAFVLAASQNLTIDQV